MMEGTLVSIGSLLKQIIPKSHPLNTVKALFIVPITSDMDGEAFLQATIQGPWFLSLNGPTILESFTFRHAGKKEREWRVRETMTGTQCHPHSMVSTKCRRDWETQSSCAPSRVNLHSGLPGTVPVLAPEVPYHRPPRRVVQPSAARNGSGLGEHLTATGCLIGPNKLHHLSPGQLLKQLRNKIRKIDGG